MLPNRRTHGFVSILIPAYNAGRWLQETIRSALGQTWEGKEIIIVDDGSTDRTLEMAKTFASDSVVVVKQDHAGAAAARNKALSISNGDYIQWLDADDLLAPGKVEEQMKAVSNEWPDMNLYSSPYGTFHYRYWKAKFAPNALWQDLPPREWLIRNFSENLWMQPAGWLVSRALADKVGPWDERLSMDDDGEYFTRVVAASRGVKFVPGARSYYRQSGFRQVSRNVSETALTSLYLSATLRIRVLLSLEESERTRAAGLGLLQAILPFFYPERSDYVEKINDLALDLGGRVADPLLGWRLGLAQKCFGPKRGRELMTLLRKLRMTAAVKWDKILYRLDL